MDHRAGGNDAENGEEEDVTHHAGDENAGEGGAVRRLQIFGANRALIQQAMRAGIGNIAADRAADDGGDRGEIDVAGREGLMERLGDRGAAAMQA